MTVERRAGVKLRFVVPVIMAGAFLVACGGTATTASPSASPSGYTSAEDLVAVAKVTFPYVAQYKYYAVCGLTGDPSPCPYTERLKARLATAKITLCRCQNPASSQDVTATPTQTGGIAHVVLGYGSAPVKLDLVIVRSSGQLLVDDELCTGGGASTSIYVQSGPC